MVNEVRNYIMECPLIERIELVLINYLSDKSKSCSINEEPDYDPIKARYITGYKECQFRFNLDFRFQWSEEIQENIDISNFFNDFRKWLEKKNKNKEYPDIRGINISDIRAVSNGYILITESNEAIYRIKCEMLYGESE